MQKINEKVALVDKLATENFLKTEIEFSGFPRRKMKISISLVKI